MSQTHLLNPQSALQFIFGGDAIFTLVSRKTRTRFTYRVSKAKQGERYFVRLLIGPDNMSDYQYVGMIQDRNFGLTEKSHLNIDSPPVVAFKWMLDRLLSDRNLPNAEFYHIGRCARCARLLTVPESIESGFGPECREKK
jgi:hypothetical protein